MQSDGSYSTLSPIVHGDIAMSIIIRSLHFLLVSVRVYFQ